jgi:hypothetical protein
MRNHKRFVPVMRDFLLVAAVAALVLGLAAAATRLTRSNAVPDGNQPVRAALTDIRTLSSDTFSAILSAENAPAATPSPPAHATAPSSLPFDHDPREFLTNMTAVTHRRGMPVACCRTNYASD